MKRRYLYALLFGIPGLFIALLISLGVVGAAAGLLWLYVFGDDPWPAAADAVLSTLAGLSFLLTWVGLMFIGYRVGRRLENDPLNLNHILISSGVTLLFVLVVVLQQWRVGNLGPKSDALVCSNFCAQKGYAGSGLPSKDSGDRSCSCYDDLGNEALKVPLDSIAPDNSK